MRLVAVHSTELDDWIAARHYLHSTPAGAVLRLEILDDNDNRIGGMLWGRPTSRHIDQRRILQLTRMYLVDDTEPYAESKALSKARQYIRRHYPQINGLITYASTGEGHEGTIYQADGWMMLGYTRQQRRGWSNRPGRIDRDLAPKVRYVRTP